MAFENLFICSPQQARLKFVNKQISKDRNVLCVATSKSYQQKAVRWDKAKDPDPQNLDPQKKIADPQQLVWNNC